VQRRYRRKQVRLSLLSAEDEALTLEGVRINDGKALGNLRSAKLEGNSVKLKGLKNGKYSLEEISPPSGFATAHKFTFNIENGIITAVSSDDDGLVSFSDDGKVLIVENDHFKYIDNISLTLGDTLGLNFYLNEIIPEDEAADYKVKLLGDCLENEQTVGLSEKNGRYFVTARVYAKDLNEKIVAVVIKDNEVIYTTEPYSVSDHLFEWICA